MRQNHLSEGDLKIANYLLDELQDAVSSAKKAASQTNK